MDDATKLARHRVAEATLQKLARRIDKTLPEGICFALVTFTASQPGDATAGYTGYVSSGQRADMIKALRECADTLEAKMDMPPGAPLGRH